MGRAGGGRGRLLVNLVPMLEQKTNKKKKKQQKKKKRRERVHFSKLASAQRCHRLGSEK